jgi:predicted small secreted protein
MMKQLIIAPLLAALAACNSPNDPGVGGVTRSEAEALNDAAAMLDNNAVTPVPEPANASAAAAR